MSSAFAARWRRFGSFVLAALLAFGCARKGREVPAPAALHGDTLVVLKGPELAQRVDSSVVIVEAQTPEGVSYGTAFAVDTLGLLVTNRHVVEGGSTIQVRGGVLADTLNATIVFTSSVCDLAVLHVPGLGLPPLPIDRKEEARVGEHVYAIGHPEGFEYSMSDGLVSGVRRQASEPTMVQHTASISPGSSGGPLLDEYGRVLGMNTKSRRVGQNLNFSVPVEDIRVGVATARAILLDGVDRTLVEGEAGFRARYPNYAANVALDSLTVDREVDWLRNQGNLETAWELAIRGLEAFPQHFMLLISAEQVAFAQERYDACYTLLDRMTVVQPDAAQTHNLRGDLLKQLSRFREAHEEYAKCIEGCMPCDPWDRDSRMSQAWCSLQMENPVTAVGEMRPVAECEESAQLGDIQAQYALFLFSAGMLGEADRAASRARSLLDKEDRWNSILDGYRLPRPVLVESRACEFDYSGQLIVRGIVRSQSPSVLTHIWVQAEGFDAAGKVVATGRGMIADPLLKGMTGAFEIQLTGIPKSVIRCDARVVSYD